jgi:hypothetical protein
MKEHYGTRDLRPDDYPIRTYDEINAECVGMYDCKKPTKPVCCGKEHFGNFLGFDFTLLLILLILFVLYVLPNLK